VFSEAQGVPGMQADFITGDGDWAGADTEAELNACIHQAEGHKVTSTFILAIIQNQTCTDSNRYDINCIYSTIQLPSMEDQGQTNQVTMPSYVRAPPPLLLASATPRCKPH